MIERQIEITTQNGKMNTFICHPERMAAYPVVLFYMDAPGIREELRDMARRLGTVGYYVMLPNLYYRSNVEELGPFVGEAHIATRERALQLLKTIDIPMVMSDTEALIEFAASDAAAASDSVGCVGYCMSGRYAINAAARHPGRVRAAASIYGTELVTAQSDSPHLVPQKSAATFYFGCAAMDPYVPFEMVDRLRAQLSASGNAEVEVFPGVHHGFAFPGRPIYNKAAAERHWERLLYLFETALKC